jgi:hypothetical protein
MTVHVRINDAATGQATPVRLRIAGPQGEFFAPFGRSSDFPVGRNEAVGGHLYLDFKKHVYIDGACEILLPTGVPLVIEISKGVEYQPIRETVTLGAGQMALRYNIRRWANLRGAGWLSVDTRCHFLSPHEALLEAAAEGVDNLHLLITEHDAPSADGHLYRNATNLAAFSGQRPLLEAAGHAVIVNTFNTHPALGRLALLQSHRPVFPLSFGEEGDDWSLGDWCNQCHRKGGLVVWCGAFRPEAALLGGEGLINLILGRVDAVELDAGERSQPFLPWWYRLLNAGVRAPLLGASGKESNRVPVGAMRTYSLVPSRDLGLASWVDQVRAGKSFVTNGPLLTWSQKEQSSGAVALTASAQSAGAFDKLELVANGEVVADAAASGSPWTATLEHELALPEGSWFALRCWGSAKPDLYPLLPAFAHSAPVWLMAHGKAPRSDPQAARSLRQPVEQTREWIERDGRFTSESRKTHLLGLCDQALHWLDERSQQKEG